MSTRVYLPGETPFPTPASAASAVPQGWQAERTPARPPARTVTHDEQSSGTLLSTPPLAPPFKEGWQAERFCLYPIARTTPRDEQSSGTLLSTPPLAPSFAEGWYSERFRFYSVARTTPHDEQSSGTILSTPPLAPPFKEGWQAERFVLRAVARALANDEQAAFSLLSIPPLASPFKEGWQAERANVRPPARTTPHDEQSSGTLLSTPPLSPPFTEGWYAERFVLRPPTRTTPHDEQSSGTLLGLPPLAPAFKEGWRPADVRPGRPARTVVFDIPLLFQFVPIVLSFPDGWQVSERAVWKPKQFTPPDWQYLSTTPLAPAFKEGWAAEGLRPVVSLWRRPDDVAVLTPGVVLPWGWQALSVMPPVAVVRALRVEGLTLSPPVSIAPVDGWDLSGGAAKAQSKTFNKASPDWQYLSPQPLASPFREGWEAVSRLGWTRPYRYTPQDWQYLPPPTGPVVGPTYLFARRVGNLYLGWQMAALPLGAPSALSLAITRARPTDINLTWTPTDGGQATSYIIERAPDVSGSPGTFVQITTTARGSTTYTDSSLDCYTPYWYRVKGSNRHGESSYSPQTKLFTSGILRALFNVAGTDLGTVSGAGDFTRPMTPTAALLRDAGINSLTSGFMGSAIANNASFAAWKTNFDASGGFPHFRDPIISPPGGGASFYWLATGDDLCRTQSLLDASTGALAGHEWGPQAVAYAMTALATVVLSSGEFCCQNVEMCDEANAVIPPSKQPPQAKVYTVNTTVREAAPRLRLGWPSDGGVNALVNATNLRPWQTLPLADYGSIYSTANAWYVPDLPGAVFSVALGVGSFPAEFAVMAQVPATPVSGLIPLGGDFGTQNADGSYTVIQGGWLPGVALGSAWVSLAYGTTTLRYYSFDSLSAWNSRVNTGVAHQYQTGCTPQVEPSKWLVMSATNNFIARVEARICGTPGTAPAWGANFVTALRTAADGTKIQWGVNITNSNRTVPSAPAGYASATKLKVDGTATDMSPAALAGSTLAPGEVAAFWN